MSVIHTLFTTNKNKLIKAKRREMRAMQLSRGRERQKGGKREGEGESVSRLNDLPVVQAETLRRKAHNQI